MAAPRDPAEGGAEHEPGAYTGVKLGSEQAPPRALKRGKTAAVTWPGFQMRPDGSSCVFLQTTAAVKVEPVRGEHKWTVDLGAVVVEGTNKLPLDTQFFNTPVTRVALKPARQHTVLELTVRADVQPRVALTQAKNGYHFLSLEFAAGHYLPAALENTLKPNVAPPPPEKSDGSALNGSRESDARAAAAAMQDDASRAAAEEQGVQAEADDAAAAELNAELPPGMAPIKTKAQGKLSAGAHAKIGER